MRVLIALLFIAATAMAQFPNQGFENWTSGLPDSWTTNNMPTKYTTITRSATSYNGNYAIKGEVVPFATAVMSPVLYAGLGAQGFAITTRPVSVQGYYQLVPQNGDAFGFSIMLYKGTTMVASAATTLPGAVTKYTLFNVPFQYYSTQTPDLCKAMFILSNPTDTLHTGSYFLLDELSLSATGGTIVKEEGPTPTSFELKQNYPNPFNPSTTISFSIPCKSFVSLKIFDALGKEVSNLVSQELPASQYAQQWNAAGLPSGLYYYRLQAGTFTEARKLVLLR